MATSEVSVMHPQFEMWYAATGITLDEQLVKNRWSGLENALTKARREDIETLVRLAFRSKHSPASSAVTQFRESFKDDPEVLGNTRELEILAASALAVLFKRGGELGSIAALAVSTATWNRPQATELPMDLPQLAEIALLQIIEEARARPDLTRYTEPDTTKLDFEKAAAKVKEQYDVTGVGTAFNLAGEATRAAIGRSEKRIAAAIAATSSFMTAQDEELQMLWWLVGGRSWDTDLLFDRLGDVRTLVIPKELADMTKRLPGPASIKPLLGRAGLNDDPVTIPNAINSCRPEWLRNLVDGKSPSPVTHPLHFGIARKLEVSDTTSWLAGWAAATDHDAARLHPAIELAHTFYRECLELQ